MEENVNNSEQLSKQPKKKSKAFMICFIIGCVIGGFAIAFCIWSSVVAIRTGNALANTPADSVMLIEIIIGYVFATSIGIAGGVVSAIAIILTGLGIKWNKAAGSSVLSVVAVAAIFMIGCNCSFYLLEPLPPEHPYEDREVGNFSVRFYDDYCEIIGTTEQGNSQRFLVIPEYIDGIKVKSFGTNNPFAIYTYNGVYAPKINSSVLEKIYFESTVVTYSNLGSGRTNFKIMYLNAIDFADELSGANVYFPRSIFESNELIKKRSNYFAANVSYYYNYDNAINDVYWIDDCDYGSKIEFIPTNPERAGYTFGGWYKEPECINEWNFGVDTLPEEQTELKEIYGSEELKEVTAYQETALYAKWVSE